MKRALIFFAAVGAVVATSKGGHVGERATLKPCPIGEGDDIACAHHACALRLDQDDAADDDGDVDGVTPGYGNQLCTVMEEAPLGLPPVMTEAAMESLPGIYVYVPHFDTFGTQDLPMATAVADPFWVDVFTASYLSKDLPQARQFVGWSVPQVDAAEPTFQERASGFVYLPIDAGLRQLLLAHKDVFAINPRSFVDVRFTYAIAEQQYQAAIPITLPSVSTPLPDPLPDAPTGLVVDDVHFVNSAAVAAGTSADLLPVTTPRNFVALHLNAPLAADADPATMIKVTRTDDGAPIVTGWTIGPDRRALFGAMVHDDAEFDVQVAKTMKSEAGAAFAGVSEEAIVTGHGFTISVAP